MKVLKRILREVGKQKKILVFLLLLLVGAAILDIAAPFIAQNVIDRLVAAFNQSSSVSMNTLFLSALGIFLATVAAQMLNNLYDYKLFKFVTKLEDKLRFEAYQKFLSLHVLYHHEINSGQIIGRIDRGSTGVYEILRDQLGKFMLQPTMLMLIVTGVLFFKDPIIALIIIAPLPIFIALILPISKKMYLTEKIALDQFEEFNRHEYDVAANVFTVKNFAQENRETARQRDVRKEARKYQYMAEKYWEFASLIQTVVSTLGRAAVIIVGGYFTMIGRTTIGELVLYITLQGMAYQPLWQLSFLFAYLRRALARAERLFTIIDEKPVVFDKPNAITFSSFKKSIEFKKVSFSYRKEREVIGGISVKIPAGKNTALVGKSGSGKSTFINLILRSFDPQKGSISIDGKDLRDIKQQSLRGHIALVSQDIELFSRSIQENIAYGRPEATQKDIEQAAKLAYCHDFIVKMKDGYKTMVGERGVKLSGGERQRIAIARAILLNPQILILDEATSHLDTESERIVQKATQNLMKGRTSIIIAHRLSTILHADKILVFDSGTIVGEGTHAQLLKSNEVYKKLYNLQFEE